MYKTSPERWIFSYTFSIQLLHIHLIDLNVSVHLKAGRSREDSETRQLLTDIQGICKGNILVRRSELYTVTELKYSFLLTQHTFSVILHITEFHAGIKLIK